MQIAIIGLPNSTKTTIFNALTRANLETTAFTSGQFEVHTATVDVPDDRVDRLSAMFKPRKTIYAKVTYADIAGLAKGVGAGGLAGQLLNTLSQSDALLHVVRAFDDPDVPHSEGSIDPCRDVAIIDDELLLSDQIIVERRIERLDAGIKKGGDKLQRAKDEAELELFKRLLEQLETGAPLRDMDLDRSGEQVAAQLWPAVAQAAADRAKRRRQPARQSARRPLQLQAPAYGVGHDAGPPRDGAGADAARGRSRVPVRLWHFRARDEPGAPREL